MNRTNQEKYKFLELHLAAGLLLQDCDTHPRGNLDPKSEPTSVSTRRPQPLSEA